MFKPLASRFSPSVRGALFRLPLDMIYGTAFLTLPTPVLTAYPGGVGRLLLPSPTLSATGNDDDNAYATLTLPAPTLTALGGGTTRLTLPAPTLTAAATSPGFATVALTLPAPTLTATAKTGEVASAALTLPTPTLAASTGAYASLELLAPTLAATGTVNHLATVALTLPFLELTATGITGAAATVSLELPALTLEASGQVGGVASVALTLPTLILTSYDAAVSTESTYSVNLNTGAVTNLLLGAFDKLVTAHGRLYGLRDGELVYLEGDTDNGSEIPVTVRFAPQAFGSNRIKRLSNIYLSSREDDGLTLDVVADERTAWRYQTATDKSLAFGTHKVKVGRGIKFHTAGLVVRNRDGGRMDIGGIELLVDTEYRRPKS